MSIRGGMPTLQAATGKLAEGAGGKPDRKSRALALVALHVDRAIEPLA